jgi:lysozyme
MKISKNGIELIKTYEGFSAKIYLCPAGKLTIGYGHLVQNAEKFSPAGITDDFAEILLKQDVSVAECALNRLLKVAVTQNRFDALASFTYNLGAKALEKSTLLRLINAGEPEKAATEFSKWIFAGGKAQSGLKKRRNAEMQLFISPVIPDLFGDLVPQSQA